MTESSTASRPPRHALECALSTRLPDAATRSALTDFYRTNAGYAEQQAGHDRHYFQRLLPVVESVVITRSPRVLEIGSGSGGALRAFLASRPDASGIAMEVSAPSLRRARDTQSAALRPIAGSALEIPLRNHSLDAVVAFEVVEHLPDVAQALGEMIRVVRRPGHIIIGLPNHASLWTPLEDRLRGRNRYAFGVEQGRGAWRWLRRNVQLTWRKRLSGDPEFLYREPILDARGGDLDAVYYAAPVDLMRFFRRRSARLVMTSAHLRFGPLAWLLPVELQGSTVMAWRVE